MLVSTRGRYALRIMMELARYDRSSYIPLPLIAERQNVSEKYLESIIAVLAKAGLVEGQRGRGGRLPHEPGTEGLLRGGNPAAFRRLSGSRGLSGRGQKQLPRAEKCPDAAHVGEAGQPD